MYIVKEPRELSFEKVGIRGKIFPSLELTESTQVCVIETKSVHETTIVERECDFIYYILEGGGYFLVDGKREDCEKGDLVVVPAGREFSYKGRLRMLLVITPPWFEEQEETLS